MNRVVMAAVVLAGLGGCRQAAPTGSAATAESELRDLGELFRYFAQENKRPARNVADLGSVVPELPPAARAVDEGRIVVLWGGGYAPGARGSAVLAYEKDVSTTGGWVLLQDGSVKQMTAAEFQSAPKAK